MYNFMTSHEEIKFLIKMTKLYYWADCIKIGCVNPRIQTRNGSVPVFQNPGKLLAHVSNGIKKFMKVVVWIL